MFCGSATCRRWKSAPAGNSSVSVSSARSVGLRLGEEARDRNRPLAHRVEDAPVPRLRDLLELDVRRRPGVVSGGGGSSLGAARCAPAPARTLVRPDACWCARLEQLHAVRERLAREIGLRPRHLHERELERKARVGALPSVLDRDREEVDEPQDGRLREAGSPAGAGAPSSPRSRAASRARGPCAGREGDGGGARAGR